MATYHGLYYPFVHFKGLGWLKTTALYWDELIRIVPAKAVPADSDDVKKLVDAGFVRDEPPAAASAAVAKPFREFVEAHADALRATFGVDALVGPGLYNRYYASSGLDDRLVYVFDETTDADLLTTLVDYRLAESKGPEPREIGVAEELAKVYMLALSSVMARDLAAHPLTDEPFDAIATSGLTVERLASAVFQGKNITIQPNRALEIEQRMATLAISTVIPEDPENIPVSAIVKLHSDYSEERHAFQDEITKLSSELSGELKEAKAEEVERRIKYICEERLAPRLKRLEHALSSNGIDTAISALGLNFALPSAVTWGFNLVGVTLAPYIAVPVSVALTVWPLWRDYKDNKNELLKPSLEAYLYQVGKAADPRNAAMTAAGLMVHDHRYFL